MTAVCRKTEQTSHDWGDAIVDQSSASKAPPTRPRYLRVWNRIKGQA
jgi:hypothetical protein